MLYANRHVRVFPLHCCAHWIIYTLKEKRCFFSFSFPSIFMSSLLCRWHDDDGVLNGDIVQSQHGVFKLRLFIYFFFLSSSLQCVYLLIFFFLPLNRHFRSAVHDVLSGRPIGRRAKQVNVEKPDLSLAVRFDIMNSIASNRRAPSKSRALSFFSYFFFFISSERIQSVENYIRR